MKILFVTGRFPFPPLKGDQAVCLTRLKELASRHEIHLISFIRSKTDSRNAVEIEPYLESTTLVKFNVFTAIIRVLFGGIFTSLPFQVLLYTDGRFRRKLNRLCQLHHIEIVNTFLLRMFENVKNAPGGNVLDLIDSMVLNIGRRIKRESRLFMRIVLKEELRRLEDYEKKVVAGSDASILVSHEEAELLKAWGRAVAVPLGVEKAARHYARTFAEKENIVAFSGNMSYFPNINAVLWFVNECLPGLRARVSNVQFMIIGVNPALEVQRLAENPSVTVTGY
ncbi:MAG: hypothetical protein HN368_24600, partial [Spirochaetales bacterium]|nr:hypothetical protein [Spirochaetales bacterium]